MIKVKYTKKNDHVLHEAVFDNLEDAQLFWETILYLHTTHQPVTPRPK